MWFQKITNKNSRWMIFFFFWGSGMIIILQRIISKMINLYEWDMDEFELLFSVINTFFVYRVKMYSAMHYKHLYYDFLWYDKMKCWPCFLMYWFFFYTCTYYIICIVFLLQYVLIKDYILNICMPRLYSKKHVFCYLYFILLIGDVK